MINKANQEVIDSVKWLQAYFIRNGAAHDTWIRITDLRKFLEEREGSAKLPVNPHFQNFANFGNVSFSGAGKESDTLIDRG